MTRKYSKKGPPVDVACGNCGKALRVPFSRAKRSPKHYCNKACMQIAQSGSTDPVKAFWLKVDKGPHPKGCWLYTGFRKWDGYGWLARRHNGRIRHMTAHRYAWILTHGEPAAGMHIMHECDIPACCNPAHLRLGTHNENMRDMKAKGRTSKGYRKHGHAVLHPDRVRPRRAA